MKKLICSCAFALGLAMGLSACTDPYDPGQRAIGGHAARLGRRHVAAAAGHTHEREDEDAHGSILLHGFDRQTIGDLEWRRRVVLAPQFHENHVLAGTLAFNLLLGRSWPASRDDLLLAEALCRDLELGSLLAKMPNGIHQVVGETGWQLSHGERSRVFLARALLQQPDVLILDESFAALDPQTLRICLRVLMKQQRTMIVIAHP